MSGYGNPTRPCGLVHSMSGPSDDSCTYPISDPVESVVAATAMNQLADILDNEKRDNDLSTEAQNYPADSRSSNKKRQSSCIRNTVRLRRMKSMDSEIR